MSLQDKIKTLRIKKGLTQDDIAKSLGTTKQTIYKYETGAVSNIPLDRLEQLAEVLETTPAYLMGWEEEKSDDIKVTAEDLEIIKMVRRLSPDREKMFLDLLKDLSNK